MKDSEDSKEKLEKSVENSSKDSETSKSQEEILVSQLCEGIETYNQHRSNVFLSALAAGLEIGFSYLLLALFVKFFCSRMGETGLFYLLSVVYPFGFIIVVLGKSLLFTEQTSLMALPVIHGKHSIFELFKLWGIVILGNIIGGCIASVLIVLVGTSLEIISYESVSKITTHVAKGNWLIILFSAVMAGWLMALLSWLLTSAEGTLAKIIIIYMITALVGLAGFHHSIVGNIEVFSGWLFTESIDLLDYLSFLSTALLGNALGGVIFVALLKYRTVAGNF